MQPIILLLSLVAAPPQPTTLPATPPPTNTMGEIEVVKRGAALSNAPSITLDAVSAKAESYAGKTVKVTGKVARVCRKTGCWLGLEGSRAVVKARVTFKDYGFFAPLDCQGTDATVEGVVEVKKLSEGERAHLASDDGVPVDQVPGTELRITASALEIYRVKR